LNNLFFSKYRTRTLFWVYVCGRIEVQCIYYDKLDVKAEIQKSALSHVPEDMITNYIKVIPSVIVVPSFVSVS